MREVAAYGWDTTSVEVLVRRLSAAMADEVEHLVALDTLVEPFERAGSLP